MGEMKKETYITRRIRNDILLVATVLLIAAAVFLFYKFTSDDGYAVVVLVDGTEKAVYSLSEDIETVIETENGYNTLVIYDGCAAITDADCPDGICVRHQEISMSGETIVCLPHKLVVEVVSQSESDIIS